MSNATTINDLPFNYVPTEWVGITFVVLFSLTTIVHLVQAHLFRLWYLIPTLILCGIGEIIGWSGRLWGALNPYNGNAFLVQITTTIISPSFMTAAIFTWLPIVIDRLGDQYSRLTPKYYKLFFIPLDVLALVIQAVGGGLASSSSTLAGANNGAHIMLVGIIVQLVAVVLFTLCAIELLLRFHYNSPVRRALRVPIELENHTKPTYKSTRSRNAFSRWNEVDSRLILMLWGLAIAVIFLIIRGIYRTIELAGGWNGKIISTEWPFVAFDAIPIVAAMITFNIFHPGYLLHPTRSYTSSIVDEITSTSSMQP